jgi:hypothetical protein
MIAKKLKKEKLMATNGDHVDRCATVRRPTVFRLEAEAWQNLEEGWCSNIRVGFFEHGLIRMQGYIPSTTSLESIAVEHWISALIRDIFPAKRHNSADIHTNNSNFVNKKAR